MVWRRKENILKSVSFHVPGKPQGKARARTFYNASAGKHMSMTPESTVLYENLIKTMYIRAAKGCKFERDTPVTLCIVARYMPAKSTSKKKMQQMLNGEILPLKKPDMDNIVKVIADALNSVAYQDDSQVVFVKAKKVYSAVEGVDVTIKEYQNMEE